MIEINFDQLDKVYEISSKLNISSYISRCLRYAEINYGIEDEEKGIHSSAKVFLEEIQEEAIKELNDLIYSEDFVAK